MRQNFEWGITYCSRGFKWLVLLMCVWGIILNAKAQTIYYPPVGPMQSVVQQDYEMLLGVPYAQPPIGENRFRAPKPIGKWDSVRVFDAMQSECFQPATEYSPKQRGSEDCLYLNIYKPLSKSGEKLPVIVWFHGGGFLNGAGNDFNGAALAKLANVMVITVNYRLGPFGWLALPELAKEDSLGSTGNYGLWDVIESLKWVQTNIEDLGGNKNNVTFMGQSAGGEMAMAVLTSPFAKGLFHRVISMSAPLSLPMPTLDKASEKWKKTIDNLGCGDPKTKLACLRSLSPERLVAATHPTWDLISTPGLQWTPTVDGVVIPEQWIDSIRKGAFQKVPVMIGHTRDEGKFFLAINRNNTNNSKNIEYYTQQMRHFFKILTPVIFIKYSFGREKLSVDNAHQVLTDAFFAIGQHKFRSALADQTPVFGYTTCDENASHTRVHSKFMSIGCGHDFDLPYLFNWDEFTQMNPVFTPEQKQLSEILVRYFGNFARTGDPNDGTLPNWPQFTNSETPKIQRIETASIGGVRTDEQYAQQYSLRFWMQLAFVKKHAIGISFCVLVALVAIVWIIKRLRRSKAL